MGKSGEFPAHTASGKVCAGKRRGEWCMKQGYNQQAWSDKSHWDPPEQRCPWVCSPSQAHLPPATGQQQTVISLHCGTQHTQWWTELRGDTRPTICRPYKVMSGRGRGEGSGLTPESSAWKVVFDFSKTGSSCVPLKTGWTSKKKRWPKVLVLHIDCVAEYSYDELWGLTRLELFDVCWNIINKKKGRHLSSKSISLTGLGWCVSDLYQSFPYPRLTSLQSKHVVSSMKFPWQPTQWRGAVKLSLGMCEDFFFFQTCPSFEFWLPWLLKYFWDCWSEGWNCFFSSTFYSTSFLCWEGRWVCQMPVLCSFLVG